MPKQDNSDRDEPEGFDQDKSEALAETSAHAAAAHSKALVEAKFIVAIKRPRNPDTARDRMLRDCKRPRFAESAIYRLPRAGKEIVGPSIRLAEAMLRHWGNVDIGSPTLYDDEEKRIVRVSVTDLESNLSYSRDITIRKAVERRSLRKGQRALSHRTNSQGQIVYTVAATDDEILAKEAALVSKWIRNLGLRLIPPDIKEEALDIIADTIRSRIKEDPDAEKKRLMDGFSELGVKPTDLVDYLGHSLDAVVPAELETLRGVFVALRDGEITWAEILEGKGVEAKAASGKSENGESAKDLTAAKDKMRQKRADKKAKKGAKSEPEQGPKPVQGELV